MFLPFLDFAANALLLLRVKKHPVETLGAVGFSKYTIALVIRDLKFAALGLNFGTAVATIPVKRRRLFTFFDDSHRTPFYYRNWILSTHHFGKMFSFLMRKDRKASSRIHVCALSVAERTERPVA